MQVACSKEAHLPQLSLYPALWCLLQSKGQRVDRGVCFVSRAELSCSTLGCVAVGACQSSDSRDHLRNAVWMLLLSPFDPQFDPQPEVPPFRIHTLGPQCFRGSVVKVRYFCAVMTLGPPK